MDNLKDIFKGSEKLAPADKILEESSLVMPDSIQKNGLRVYSMDQLLNKVFPEEQWVIDGLIPEGITVLSAAPASFKTWVVLSVAISVASGQKLFGYFDSSKTGVLMIDEEDNPRLLQKRLELLGANKELPVHLMIGQDFKIDAIQVTKVISFCKENNIGLITIDSLVRVHNAKENSASDMAEVFSTLRRFHKAGINVLITHHNRKGKSDNSGDDMRGSSDIFAAVDCNLSVNKTDKQLVIKQVKLRTAQEIGDISVQIDAGSECLDLKFLGISEPSISKQSWAMDAIQLYLEEVKSANQLSIFKKLNTEKSSINIKTVRAILKKMVTSKLLIETRGTGNEILYRLSDD